MLTKCTLFPKFDKGEAEFQMKVPDQTTVNRITLRGIGAEILAQFNLEKGLGYTIRELLVAPDRLIATYLFEDRSRIMRPLPLLLLVVTVTTLTTLWHFPMETEINDSIRNSDLPSTIIPAIEQFVYFSRQYYNLLLMSSLPAIAFGSFLLFGALKLHYAEHLVINTYIFSIQTILTLPFVPFVTLAPWLGVVMAGLSAGYFLYAYREIFQRKWGEIILKTVGIFLIAQMLQGILFMILIFIFWLVL